MSTTAPVSPSTESEQKLEALALNYSKRRERVTDIANQIEDEVRAIYRRHRRALNEAIATAEGAQDALRAEINAQPALFEKPRHRTAHGIKFGYRKGTGKLDWEDDAEVVARIKKLYATEEAELLIRTTEKPISDALRDLDAKTLAKLGVSSEDTSDVVFVKAVDGEAQKLVKRLLKEGEGRTEEIAPV